VPVHSIGMTPSPSLPERHFVDGRVIGIGPPGDATDDREARRVGVTRHRPRKVRVGRGRAKFPATLFARPAEHHGPGRARLEPVHSYGRVTGRSRRRERRRRRPPVAAARLSVPSRHRVHRRGRQVGRPVSDRRGHAVRVGRRRDGRFFTPARFRPAISLINTCTTRAVRRLSGEGCTLVRDVNTVRNPFDKYFIDSYVFGCVRIASLNTQQTVASAIITV